jgi:hypothetical protein
MGFELKKKLQEGKAATTAAFKKAVEAGNAVADKVDAGKNRFINKVEEKVLSLRKKKQAPEAPKQD